MKHIMSSSELRQGVLASFPFRTMPGVMTLLISALSLSGAQVDQQNWTPELIVSSSDQSQQEFTPTLNTLDSVQLWIPRGDQLPIPLSFGSSAVNIRQGGINGPIIAASRPTYVPPHYSGPVGFGFSQPVQLVPGQLYALEPIKVTADVLVFGNTPDRYPGKYLGMSQYLGYDLVFREGIGLDVIPEPSPALLFAAGIGLAVATRPGARIFAKRKESHL